MNSKNKNLESCINQYTFDACSSDKRQRVLSLYFQVTEVHLFPRARDYARAECKQRSDRSRKHEEIAERDMQIVDGGVGVVWATGKKRQASWSSVLDPFVRSPFKLGRNGRFLQNRYSPRSSPRNLSKNLFSMHSWDSPKTECRVAYILWSTVDCGRFFLTLI